jgi:hypothetical protein
MALIKDRSVHGPNEREIKLDAARNVNERNL